MIHFYFFIFLTDSSGICCPIPVLNKFGQFYRSLVIGKVLELIENLFLMFNTN